MWLAWSKNYYWRCLTQVVREKNSSALKLSGTDPRPMHSSIRASGNSHAHDIRKGRSYEPWRGRSFDRVAEKSEALQSLGIRFINSSIAHSLNEGRCSLTHWGQETNLCFHVGCSFILSMYYLVLRCARVSFLTLWYFFPSSSGIPYVRFVKAIT